MKPDPSLLLMPVIPKPLHGIAPRVVLGDAWWDIERKKAYAKAGFRCEACGVEKEKARFHRWLEAHERYDIDYARGRMVFVGLVALCHACHNYIHRGRLAVLKASGEITPGRYDAIMAHGDKLTAKLKRPPAPEKVAPWGAWRMIFDKARYGPSTPNEEAWARGAWRDWKPKRKR